ncbi:hypothetical protein [Amycolatopsis eburnea]|uniref:Uncharacterized protein n=1 Tax=Amycolatopsis eburnea TaxID=2267691 RepID=A0A3R9E2L1_9PSEU|nr:hypothetical protein [Amycolatopsis eburnea]RSD16295.1 hypothetical protein EIY87_21775 [Amycolatopsis eburnea]
MTRSGTIAERILETLRISGRPWDDDELAQRLGVAQRQTVNQICRRLAADGRLQRYTGGSGKLVNALWVPQPDARVAYAPATAELVLGDSIEVPPGSSVEQRAAEALMIASVARELGLKLTPRPIATQGGVRVEIDGVDDACTVLVEAWAHQGPPKSAQRHKVLADAFKLSWFASTLPVRPRLILCFSDEAAAKPFRSGRAWAAAALRDQRIEVFVAELPEQVRADILEAQRRQYR